MNTDYNRRQMTALILKDKQINITAVPPPEPAENEALIRVTLAGICATDEEMLKGYMNFSGVPGHEFVGVVEACDGMPELIGRRVVGDINVGCSHCEQCRRGFQRHCRDRTVLGIAGRDGAFAQYLVLPVWNLHQVPAAISDRAAVMVEPLAAAFEILEQVHLIPGTAVLLLGDGKLAQMIVRVLARAGCLVEVVGRHEAKVRRMKGFATKGYLNAPPPGRQYPVVIEATGSPRGWRVAVGAVKPRGTIVLKSTYTGGLNFNPAPLVVNEITVVGSRCGDFNAALAALADGLKVEDLIDGEFRLDQYREAFARSGEPDSLKVIFKLMETND